MNNPMDEKLMTCPFDCGGHLAIISQYGGRHFFVQCDSCGACGPTFETEEGAVERWNRRAAPRDAVIVVHHRQGR